MSSNITPDPRDAQAYFHHGLDHLRKKEWDSAIADYNKAIGLNPQHADSYFNRGVAYGNKEESNKAITDFSKAINLDPKHADAYFNRGAAYGNKEELDKAITDYNKATKLNPQHADAYFNRGAAYSNKEEWNNAIADFNKVIALNPQHADAYFNRGVAYSEKEKWDNAIADFSKTIEIDTQNADAYINRGNAYLAKEEWDNAIADFNKAIALNPQHADAYFNRGVAYSNKGEWNNAIADCNKAIELNPQRADTYFNRGVAYSNKGEWDNAIADCNKAIELNPQHIKAYFNRGVVYGKKGELDNAIADFSKAIDLDPKHADAYAARGHAYLEKEEWDKTFDDFVYAGRKEPASKSKYAEVYVASVINNVTNNENNPKVLRIFFQILKKTASIQNALFYERHEARNPKEIAHYTSFDTLKNLVNKGRFRLYNSAYMNDPEEGSAFFKIMDKIVNARTQGKKETGQKYDLKKEFYGTGSDIPYRSPAYIGTFIPVDSETLKDKLSLWRTYGKQNGEEGTDSCLIFPEKSFAAKNYHPQIGHMKTASADTDLEEQDSKPPIYKIAYIDKEKIKEGSDLGTQIDGQLSKDLNELAICLEKVGGIIESMPDDTEKKLKHLVRELLDSIRFLFKASRYEGEREFRVLQLYYPEENTEKSGEIKVDAEQTPPRFYLEAPKSFRFSEVILGPRVQNFGNWEWWIREQHPNIKVRKSKIKHGG